MYTLISIFLFILIIILSVNISSDYEGFGSKAAKRAAKKAAKRAKKKAKKAKEAAKKKAKRAKEQAEAAKKRAERAKKRAAEEAKKQAVKAYESKGGQFIAKQAVDAYESEGGQFIAKQAVDAYESEAGQAIAKQAINAYVASQSNKHLKEKRIQKNIEYLKSTDGTGNSILDLIDKFGIKKSFHDILKKKGINLNGREAEWTIRTTSISKSIDTIFKKYSVEYLSSKNQLGMEEIPDVNINTHIYGQFEFSFYRYGASDEETNEYFSKFIVELYPVIYNIG